MVQIYIFKDHFNYYMYLCTIVEKASFDALIGKEKSVLSIFHHMYSEIPGTEFNY